MFDTPTCSVTTTGPHGTLTETVEVVAEDPRRHQQRPDDTSPGFAGSFQKLATDCSMESQNLPLDMAGGAQNHQRVVNWLWQSTCST